MRIAVLGLGRMGAPMARNLAEVGHQVTLFNRTRARSLELGSTGGRVASSVAEAVAEAQVALTMVSDDAAEEALTFGPNGLLARLPAGAIHLCMSTIGVETSRKLAAAHAEKGQGYVAAPVFGRPGAAASRHLWIVAGGPDAQVTRCLPIFDAVSRGLTRVGSVPEVAHAAKLGGNLLAAVMVEGLSEVLAFGERAGLSPAEFLRLLNTAIFKSPLVDSFGGLMVRHTFEPADLSLNQAARETQLALWAAEGSEVSLPMADLLRQRFEAADAQGLAAQDLSVLFRASRMEAGLEEALVPRPKERPVPASARIWEAAVKAPGLSLEVEIVPPEALPEDPEPSEPEQAPVEAEAAVAPEAPPVPPSPTVVEEAQAPELAPEAEIAPPEALPESSEPPEPEQAPVEAEVTVAPVAPSVPEGAPSGAPEGAEADLPPAAAAPVSQPLHDLHGSKKKKKHKEPKHLPPSPKAPQPEVEPVHPKALEPATPPVPPKEPSPVASLPLDAPTVTETPEKPAPVEPLGLVQDGPLPTYSALSGEERVILDLKRTTHFEVIDGQVWAWHQEKRYRTGWRSLAVVEATFRQILFLLIQQDVLLQPETVLELKPVFGGGARAKVGPHQELKVSRAATPRLKELLGV